MPTLSRPRSRRPRPARRGRDAVTGEGSGGLVVPRKPAWSPNRIAPPEETTITIRRTFREKVVAVGDLHFPFTDGWRLREALRIIRAERPDRVVQMGDIYDLYSYSRFPIDATVITPDEELYQARACAERFWENVHEAAPRARCHQILGNHDARMLKAARRLSPAIEGFLKMTDHVRLWHFPGVETQPDDRAELEVDGVLYHHGHRAQLGAHSRFNLQHTVVGHTHKGGVFFSRCRGTASLWELNCGYLADDRSPAMAYSFQSRSSSVPGIGIVDRSGPRFIAF